jgi:tRNA(Ile)-lysidine synthetase-like protein
MRTLNIIWPAPGNYILAVSGGADSMVLLDVMAQAAVNRGYKLSVAHFDHGIRTKSAQDCQFVTAAALRYNLPVEFTSAHLGVVSEATARSARHSWLEQIRLSHSAQAILTAHHQDDLLETSLLNLARGSSRRGLAPMQSSPSVQRPLLKTSRSEIREYAHTNNVAWREDPTNADLTNPRNFIRHELLPAAPAGWREVYLTNITELAELNTKITQSISVILESARTSLDSYTFSRRSLSAYDERELIEIMAAAASTLRPGIELGAPLLREAAQFARTNISGKFRPLRLGISVLIVPGFTIVTTKTPL